MLNINILTKNISLDEPLRVFVQDKIGGLDKYLQNMGEISAQVEIGKPSEHHHKGPVFYAEANLKIAGTLLRAQAEHEDLRSAIVAVKDELQEQIKKFKEKNRESTRKP